MPTFILEGKNLEQDSQEFEWLLSEVKKINPVKLLEVGVRCGASLRAYIDNFPTFRQAVAVDPFTADYDCRGQWTWPGSDKIVVVQGLSQSEAVRAKVVGLAPFDFVFIDADHSYEGMLGDWNRYSSMVKPGGIMAFHDISPTQGHNFGGWRFWPELKARGLRTGEMIVEPGKHCFGVGIVYL